MVLDQWFSNLNLNQNLMERVRFPQANDLAGGTGVLGGPRTCISNKFPIANAFCPGTF